MVMCPPSDKSAMNISFNSQENMRSRSEKTQVQTVSAQNACICMACKTQSDPVVCFGQKKELYGALLHLVSDCSAHH